MASFPFWVFGKPVMKSILTLSHSHLGIGNGWRVPTGLWCSALMRWQTSHSATYRATSIFILVHQNLWRRSRHIFVLPGWIERGVSWASLIISLLRLCFRGTTKRVPRKTTPWSFMEKYLATPLAMFFLISRIPLYHFSGRLWCDLQGLVSPPGWKGSHEEQSQDWACEIPHKEVVDTTVTWGCYSTTDFWLSASAMTLALPGVYEIPTS